MLNCPFINSIIIVLLVVFFISLLTPSCKNSYDGFSNSPTNYILENPSKNIKKYASLDEEIMLGSQESDTSKTWEFTKIKAPLGKYVLVNSMYKSGTTVFIKRTLIQIEKNEYETLNLLGFGKALVNEVGKQVKYTITFLSDGNYLKVRNALHNASRVQNDYNKCVKSKQYDGMSPVLAKKECGYILNKLKSGNILYI